jgi:hypothetical protein
MDFYLIFVLDYIKPVLRIRIRIQYFLSMPIRIRIRILIQGFDDQKLEKIYTVLYWIKLVLKITCINRTYDKLLKSKLESSCSETLENQYSSYP